MPFFQTPPALGNQFSGDRVLKSFLARTLDAGTLRDLTPQLEHLGAMAVGPLHERSITGRLDEPKLTHWDAWGNRVDRIELTPLWKEMQVIAAQEGLVATAYERKHGALSRIHQFAAVYLIDPASHVYSCPLAMTDGAAKTLSVSGNQALMDRALPRLLSRDPKTMWTSGQWMTERTGGSDVAISEAVATKDGDAYRLSGTKWFTSATTSEMTLTLARPEGNPPGGSGLALFYLEVRGEDGRMNGITINRLKDKLGTRMVPTAELTLDGARAVPVMGTTNGIKNITPMLAITRTWNSVGAICGMRRAIALARDYAQKRVAFGAPLSEKPLHVDTLAAMQAEFEGAFHLAFRTIELLGREEAKTITEEDAKLLRLLTPLVKLTTGKQAVAVISEALEAFGGAGYVEDTGLPRMLRDAQVLPIWEGTTNVLSLDVLRALGREASFESIVREVHACVKGADASLAEPSRAAVEAVARAGEWIAMAQGEGMATIEAGARRFAMTLGRALELALLVKHADWSLRVEKDGRAAAAARRLAKHGVDLLATGGDAADAKALANDSPL